MPRVDLSAKAKAYYQANKDKWVGYRAARTDEQRQRCAEANKVWIEANKDKYLGYRKAAREDGRAKVWDRKKSLKHKYGITLEEYEGMLTAQGSVCAVCGEKCATHENLCVDHCHLTGKVRGLLCLSCNAAIGKLKDSPDLLRRAAKYIETQG